jgi:5-(carboxyamino)imidazole ribonucleotide synthase
VLTAEFFLASGALIANEIAPRVHNSGHWTIEGAETSQFENHLRAILGWPLGDATPRGYAAMLNLLGGVPDVASILSVPGVHLHDYGKEPRPGRKVGHCTLLDANRERLVSRLTQLRNVVERVE